MCKKISMLIIISIFIVFLFPIFTFGVTTYRGIDVSVFQGTIDWASVAADDIDFVIIKATEGNTIADSRFKENAQNAYNNNIAVGAYHLGRFSSVDDAISEADFFLETIQDVNINYAVALDLEFTGGMDVSTLTSAAIAFLEKVKAAGYTPLLYSYQYFFLTSINYTDLENFDFWVAKYSSNPPTIPFVIWQYTSSGSVNGISDAVDMNIAYADLRHNTIGPNSGNNGQNNTTSNQIISNSTTNSNTNTTNETTNNISNSTNSNSTNNNVFNENNSNASNTNFSIIDEISNNLDFAFIIFAFILFTIIIMLAVILILANYYYNTR